MIPTSRNITIFEGPDGAGKTTLAEEFAALTSAHYVHFGPLPRVTTRWGLGRIYLEAMMPALLGHRDVVMDRSWLSEAPYAAVKGTHDRMGHIGRRMLTRVAFRAATVVVQCAPPFDVARQCFELRAAQGQEYLDDAHQLQQVYDLYAQQDTVLPRLHWDYTSGSRHHLFDVLKDPFYRTTPHSTRVMTVGRIGAPFVLVGESFAAHTDHDAWTQFPFVQLGPTGTSAWFTEQCEKAGLMEEDLLWANADMDLARLPFEWSEVRVIALGEKAHVACGDADIPFFALPHPSYVKRFGGGNDFDWGFACAR